MFTVLDGFTFFPATLSLVWSAYNLRAWPDDAELGVLPPKLSVLIPARDEVDRIGEAVRAALAAMRGGDELIVCDDGSTDGTDRVLAGIDDPRLRVIQGAPLPPGWVGKPHACHQLAAAATGDWLLFVDADVTLRPDGPARLAGTFGRYDADVLTAFPHQQMGSLAERLLLPFLPVTLMSWIPLDAVWRSPRPWLLVATGQILLVRRAGLEAIGGFAAIRDAVVDDMALCAAAKRAGLRVVFASATRAATCRMYTSGRALWEGFSKNLYLGLGANPALLLAAVTLYLSACVLPFVRAAVEWDLPWTAAARPGLEGILWEPGARGWEAPFAIVATLAARVLVALRTRQPLWPILAHPLAAIGVVAMALNSARWVHAGRVIWRGRTYGAEVRR
jgi:chlorobactene glucosyltransferase